MTDNVASEEQADFTAEESKEMLVLAERALIGAFARYVEIAQLAVASDTQDWSLPAAMHLTAIDRGFWRWLGAQAIHSVTIPRKEEITNG